MNAPTRRRLKQRAGTCHTYRWTGAHDSQSRARVAFNPSTRARKTGRKLGVALFQFSLGLSPRLRRQLKSLIIKIPFCAMSGAKVTIRFITNRVRYLQLGWFVWAVVMLPVHAGACEVVEITGVQ